MATLDSFGTLDTLQVDGKTYRYHNLGRLKGVDLKRIPYSIKILLENMLRHEDEKSVTRASISRLAKWEGKGLEVEEISFSPARVLLQDFTGVPVVVDLAAMREAMRALGGDPKKINPIRPVELVIDHSVQVDASSSATALNTNIELEFERNHERYAFLRWGDQSLKNFRVVPPGKGICHQVNLEYLARLVFAEPDAGALAAYPDTLVGTDSHTTMINGLGVLGWGVGGIEAEAAMLGQPITMVTPRVIGFRLHGSLREGVTGTDLVLTITQVLRKKGVVGAFVEFYGEGIASIPLPSRATISNMCPEYGATASIWPVDAETLRYFEQSGRPKDAVRLAEAYYKAQGMFHAAGAPTADYTEVLDLDLGTVEACISGPKRPQDRIPLRVAHQAFANDLNLMLESRAKTEAAAPAGAKVARPVIDDKALKSPAAHKCVPDSAAIDHGSVVIAAITSCTNTSNPYVMMAAGILAKKAATLGLQRKPWVKASLAPGSRVVSEYLTKAGLQPYLDQLGFNVVGYGCTTCIGNSGPLPGDISREIESRDLIVAAVLSGNRNFEARINAEVRANYLASPPLVVAYALAGSMFVDFNAEALGKDREGRPVYLRDIWPTEREVQEAVDRCIDRPTYERIYADIFTGDEHWRGLEVPKGDFFLWGNDSTYIRFPPYFVGMTREPAPPNALKDARVLVFLGDSVTTDHISPAGSIKPQSPAGVYLIKHGVAAKDFNSYGARRGNDEVMVRGTFANVRLRNFLVPAKEGPYTRILPSGEEMTIFDASERYKKAKTPLIVLAGKEYGTGSSRDWAAKGPALLGIGAVIAESFERIHRSNLVGMGILPLQFNQGDSAAALGLTGTESYTIEGIEEMLNSTYAPNRQVKVTARAEDGSHIDFKATVRIDTPVELEYYRHGGIMPYVIRQSL